MRPCHSRPKHFDPDLIVKIDFISPMNHGTKGRVVSFYIIQSTLHAKKKSKKQSQDLNIKYKIA